MVDFARRAGVSTSTVRRPEGDFPQRVTLGTTPMIREVLVDAGITSLEDEGLGEGIRLGPRARAGTQARRPT